MLGFGFWRGTQRPFAVPRIGFQSGGIGGMEYSAPEVQVDPIQVAAAFNRSVIPVLRALTQ